MRFPFSSLRLVRRLAPVVALALCGGVAAAQTCTTTITGHVYSPLGPTNGGDPIPNILVYWAQGTVQPFVLNSGPQSCAYQQSLVTGAGTQPVENTTVADGSFSMSTSLITASGPLNFVIQAGKWRRQYPNTQITACTTNNVDAQYSGGFTMPASQTQGDLPHIAVVTGDVDGAECIFPQIGIAKSEVTTPSGGGSINLYQGATDPGQGDPDATTANPTPSETALVSSYSTMMQYDVIMFACQGTPTQTKVIPASETALTQNEQNVVNFTSNGGRVFATHFEYIWLRNTFPTTADWDTPGTTQTPKTTLATVDQTWANGVILSQWLRDINADTGTLGQIQLNNNDINETGVNKPPSQSWANLNDSTDASMQFTFDTPLNSNGVPAVTIAYTNVTKQFKAGDTSDEIVVSAMNISTTATTPGLSMAITLPAGLTATSATDPTGSWTCVLTPSITCTEPVALAASASDSVTLVFSIASNESVGTQTISTALSGGGISGTGQCGRVLYNDYHVEAQSGVTAATVFPAKCSSGATTAQEKFLEYSLYDLSNFIATNTTDNITIAGTPTITWPTPAPIPYGAPLTSTQLDATATFSGTAVAGTYVYTPTFGYTGLPVGSNPATNTLSVVFTPTDQVDYTSATGSVVQSVIADTTMTVLTSAPNPSFSGQSVTFTATVTTNGAVAAGQAVTFSDGLSVIGNGMTNAQGVATYSTSSLIVGTHSMTACMTASADFNGSCSSPALVQLVTLIPTPPLSTTAYLTSNANPSLQGQTVTFTVGVATSGAFSTIPAGTVTFYDGTTALGAAVTLDVNGFATFPIATLALGTHSITAVYSGSTTLATSTSNVVMQLVLTTLPSAGTGFLLTVDPTTVSVGVGASAVLNVSVLDLNNFQQTVNLSCTGTSSSNEIGCAFAKSAIPIGGGVTTLTVTPAAPHACGASSPYFVATGMQPGIGTGLLAAGALGLFFARRRKRLFQGLTLALALCLVPMLGGGCSSNCTDLGTQPGTYVLTVTATSTGTGTGANAPITQTQTIVLTAHL